MKKKAVEDGNYGENITYTQNIYNDKVAYSNIINKEENNLKIIQPMKNSKKSLCCTKSCCDSCCVISSDPNVNGQYTEENGYKEAKYVTKSSNDNNPSM